jgi:hypothetical protein
MKLFHFRKCKVLSKIVKLTAPVTLFVLLITGGVQNMLYAEEYDIPDPAFKQLILNLMKKTDGKLTAEDYIKISHLVRLDISGANIASIEGIQNFSSLRSVSIDETQVTDLSPLAVLDNLETLSLINTNIDDFSNMPGLLNLENLFIITSHEIDISSLQKLNNLKSLNITWKEMNLFDFLKENDVNQAQPLDLSQVSKLTELEALIIEYPKLANYGSLAKLKKLIWLKLYSYDSIDLAFVKEMKGLVIIELSNPEINDLTPLSGLENLENITIKRNSLKDISPLLHMDSLKEVSIVINDNGDIIRDQLSLLSEKGIKTKRKILNSYCTMTLRVLGISQNYFRDKNPDNNFGTWDELVKGGFVRDEWTPETIIEDYRFVIFEVTPSVKNQKGEITKESTFRIVAAPKVETSELDILAIDESQVLKVWIGNEYEWDVDNIDLNNPDLWEPVLSLS